MLDELREHVSKVIGPIAKPDDIIFTPDLPEDAVRQDHAPAAARRGPRQHARRRHDAGERRDRRADPRAGGPAGDE